MSLLFTGVSIILIIICSCYNSFKRKQKFKTNETCYHENVKNNELIYIKLGRCIFIMEIYEKNL